jgi:hypothetical protein
MEQTNSQTTPTKPNLEQWSAAYASAWAEIDNVVKNAQNPHFGSNYADLSAVLNTIRPVFAKHGLALLQSPGEMSGDKISMTWMLVHKSGQIVSGRMEIPAGAKLTAQAIGSAITYGRRYQASAVGGIAQVDDDGNAASQAYTPPPAKAGKKADRPPIDDEVAGLLKSIEGSTSLADLETLRGAVQDLGDQAVAKAYLAKKKAHKEAQ